jgi:hypothetical protein
MADSPNDMSVRSAAFRTISHSGQIGDMPSADELKF